MAKLNIPHSKLMEILIRHFSIMYETESRLANMLAGMHHKKLKGEVSGHWPDTIFINHNQTAETINTGDCGVAAVAIGIAFSELTGERVEYYATSGHGFIGWNGTYFDIAHPTGYVYTSTEEFRREFLPDIADGLPITGFNLSDFLLHWMTDDEVGTNIVNRFLTSVEQNLSRLMTDAPTIKKRLKILPAPSREVIVGEFDEETAGS